MEPNVVGTQKSCLTETFLLSAHNKGFYTSKKGLRNMKAPFYYDSESYCTFPIDPFPPITVLQQTTLKTAAQKYDNICTNK